MPLFDTYVMVDWSASNSPAKWPPGKDSIWWAAVQDRKESRRVNGESVPVRIPPAETIVTHERTRHSAIHNITKFLENEIEKDRRVLLGFDFAFGYPMGAAKKMTGNALARAEDVWELLFQRIEDDSKNHNDRFRVAAEINRKIVSATDGISDGPFWCFPTGERKDYRPRKDPYSKTRKPSDRKAWPIQSWPKEFGFDQERITDVHAGSTPVWKLSQSDSVGSQVLMGLPWLWRLRERFREHCLVWPFETGFDLPSDRPEIMIVEIYPSLIGKAIKDHKSPHEVMDRAQVRLNALAFALLGEDGSLEDLFRGPDTTKSWEDLNRRELEREGVEKEEGWILGVDDRGEEGHKERLVGVLREHFSAEGERGAEGAGSDA